jgi:hypothetical protein
MKVTTFTKLAIGLGVAALSVAGVVVPAHADPSGPSSTALVGFGSDTTQDVMDEIATAIGGGKLASYKSIIGPGQTEYVQVRPGGPTQVIRAKGSGDGYNMLTVAEGSVATNATIGTLANATLLTANKANTVGQIDYARASGKRGTADNAGEYVNVPFAIDSVGIAVNPQDAVAKIPLEGLGATTDAATKATVMSIFRCQARYVYINNIAVGDGTVTGATFTKASHGLVVGDRVTFSVAAGSLPSGLTAGTNYYVKTVPSTSTFTVSATKTGTDITTDGAATTVTITQTMGSANSYNSVGATEGAAPANTTGYVISPLIPVFGSGTAAYFVGKIGRTEAASFPLSGDAGQNCISRKMLDGTTNIQEHDGSSVAERENSIGAYSIGQWASQTNSANTGVVNRTSGTTLLTFFPKVGGNTSVASNIITTASNHGLVVGDIVRFSSTGTLPEGLAANTNYFVKAVPTSTAFTVSETVDGNTVITTSAGDGTLSTIKVVRPTVGSGATLAPNEFWSSDLQRVVYNVMSYRKASDPNHPLNAMFVGPNSLVCQQRASIAKMGFTVLSGTDPSDVNTCGSIANGNRARQVVGGGSAVTDASIAAFPTSGTVGVNTTKVKIGTSIHQMGGTVQVRSTAKVSPATPDCVADAADQVLGTVNVAAGVSGSTETNIDVVLPNAVGVTYKLYACFIPNLGGIKVTPLLFPGSAVTADLTSTKAEPNVTLSIRKPAGIGGTGRVIAIVQAPVAPGGAVELFRTGAFPTVTGVTTPTPITTFTLKTPAVANAFSAAGTNTTHGLTAGTPVKFSGASCNASGTAITVGTTYFVSATGLTTTAFRVATTATGTAINTPAGALNCTVTSAAPTVFTATAHGLAVGNRLSFTSGTLPTGFAVDTDYFVASVPSANTFTLAATSGGAGIAATANGSGTYSMVNSTPLSSGTLAEGETAEVLSYTQSLASMSLYARYVPASNTISAGNSRDYVVSVPKLAASLASTLPAAPNGFVAGTTGTLTAFATAAQDRQLGTVNATLSYTNDTFAIASHGLQVNDPVRFTATTLPTGIAANTTYYVISEGFTTGAFKVSTTRGGSAVNLGTQVTQSNLVANATTDTFTSSTAHGLTAGTIVQFQGTTLPAGITAGTNYFVRTAGLTATVFSVSTTAASGAVVNFTTAGTAVAAFTGGGVAVKVFTNNVAPRVTLTATGPAGATAKPSGTIRVYIGSSASDRTREIPITGAALAALSTGAAGAATATLQQAALWSGLSNVSSSGQTVYLIMDYSGDGVYDAATLNKAITLRSGR